MYKAKLWDEDKWNIHSSSYASSKYGNIFSDGKKDDKKYHEQKYGTREKDKKDENTIFSDIEEDKKEEQDIKEDEIPFKAAKQLFSENNYENKKSEQKQDIKTIEDAIKKAIEEEKKVVIMDN